MYAIRSYYAGAHAGRIAAGIQHPDAGVLSRQGQVTGPGTFEEIQLLEFDAIELTAVMSPPQAQGWVDVQVEGQIGRKIAQYSLLDLADQRRIDTPAPALIGLGGEIVAIPDHPATGGQRRFDTRITSYNVCYTKLLRCAPQTSTRLSDNRCLRRCQMRADSAP